MRGRAQGWMSHSLATSSLLKAVGVDVGSAGTAGATAAVRWITKDGIGALGRLLVPPPSCPHSRRHSPRRRCFAVPAIADAAAVNLGEHARPRVRVVVRSCLVASLKRGEHCFHRGHRLCELPTGCG